MITRYLDKSNINTVLPKMCQWIGEQVELSNKIKIELSEYNNSRSISQNKLLWGVFHKEACLHLKEHFGLCVSAQALHEDIVERLGYYKEQMGLNGFKKVRESTSKMSTKRFAQFLNDYEQYALTNWNLQFSHPEDIYLTAMYEQEKNSSDQ